MKFYTIFLLLMVTWYGAVGRSIDHRRVKRAKVKNTTQNGDTTADGESKGAKSTTEDEKAKGLSAIVVIGNRTHRVSGPVVKELLFELQHQQEEDKPKSSDAISRDTSAGSSSDPSSTNSMPYFNLRRLYAANEVAEINKLLGKPLTDAKALGLIKNLLLDKVHTHLAKTMDQNGQSDISGVVQSESMPHMPQSAASPTASLRLIQDDSGAISASNVHDREELATPNEVVVTCHDSDPVDKCQYLKDIGLCGEVEKHPGVRRRCQKTCGLCDWTCDDTECHPPPSLKEPTCKEPPCVKEEPCKQPPCNKPTQHIGGCHPEKDASCLIIVQEQHDKGQNCKDPPCYVVHEAQDVHESPCKEKGTCVLEEHDPCKEHACVIQLHPHLTTPLPIIHHTSFKATEATTAGCALLDATFRPDICPASRYATPTQLAVLDAGSTIHPLLTNLPSHPTSPPESIGLLEHDHHDLVVHPTLHPTLLHPTIHPSVHPSWHPSVHPVLHDAELHPGQVRVALHQPLNPTPLRPSMHVVMHDGLHATLKPSLRPTIDLHHDVLHPSAQQAVILHPTLRPSLRPGLIHPTLQPTLHPTLHPTAHLDLHPLAVEPAEPPGTTSALISPTGICELPLEIGIAIDTSAAMVPHWQQMLYFVKSLVDRFEMGAVSRIGVITFDTIGKIPIPLDRYRDSETLKVHLDKLFADPYGRRRTDSALEVARSPFFERGRPGIPKVLFLVEHGRINGGDPSINWEDLLLEPAEKLREIGVNVFAVGATPVVTPEELKILTGDWSHVVPLQSYGQLQGIVPQLAIKACKLAGIVRRSKSRTLH